MQRECMYSKLFQQLTMNELEQYIHELELAVENHTKWLAQINRTLICHLPAQESDLNEVPHLLCTFGRWYHAIDNPAITSLELFREIGEVHTAMHLCARALLEKGLRGTPITTSEYDNLVDLSSKLRTLVQQLRHDLNQNHNLTSRLMGKVFENANEGVVITAPDTTIVSVNNAFTRVTGYSREEVLGKSPSMLKSGRQDEAFYTQMWKEIDTFGQWQGEIWNRNKAGEYYLEWLSVAAVKDEHGELSHYVGIFSDITSEKESAERLQYLAHFDQLTDLPNRILFNDRLKQAIGQSRRDKRQVAIMFLDLDGFKAINDSLGHNAGDELLRLVAVRLTKCLRATDTVARFGGDEFTVVLPAIDDRDSVEKIARKITEEVALPYDLYGNEASVTTSIGISLYPDDGNEPHVLVQRADNAMYHAKRHGKNHHEFYEGP